MCVRRVSNDRKLIIGGMCVSGGYGVYWIDASRAQALIVIACGYTRASIFGARIYGELYIRGA